MHGVLVWHTLKEICFVFVFCFIQNESAFDEVFQQANFKTFVFRNRVKLETYNVSNCFYANAHSFAAAFAQQIPGIKLGNI